MTDYTSKRERELEKRLVELIGAVSCIYFAAVWHPDREVKDENKMWERLREACGFDKGHSTAVLFPNG